MSALGLYIAGSALRGVGALRRGRQEDEAAKRNAALIEQQTEESIRRRELEDAQNEALARALAAARGTGRIGVSDQAYLDFMVSENRTAREFDREYGFAQAQNERDRGSDALRGSRIEAASIGLSSWGLGRKWWG